MDRYEMSKANLCKKGYIFLGVFEVLLLNFSLTEETMRNIHNINVTNLAHCKSLLHAGVTQLFCPTGILVWHLFSLGILKPSPFHLSWCWLPRYSTILCCLMAWPQRSQHLIMIGKITHI